MKQSDHQWEFLKDLAMLIQWASNHGYKLTGAELYRTPHEATRNEMYGTGIKDSLHTQRLAIDLNLFIDDVYQTDSLSHKPLGEYWKSLSPLNRWGGDFSRPDGNHYERNA